MIKTSFTKIELDKINPGQSMESQLCSLKAAYVEEHYSENAEFIRAIDKSVKLRNQWAHQDLLKLFDKMRCHLALICEMATGSIDTDDPFAEMDSEHLAIGIFATGVHFSGGDENLKVSISGFRMLANENRLELKTPAIRIDGEYPFATQLLDLLTDLEQEAKAAIYQQKGCNFQLDLFADNEPGEAPQEKPKTKSKVKSDFLEGLGFEERDGKKVFTINTN
jgi:hypothetical protein